jgi:hypothetical protein
MEQQPPQLNGGQKEFIINSINDRLQKAVELAKTCDGDAGRSSRYKRRGRWINGIGGGLIALGGIVLTALPPNAEIIRKYIGIASAVAGSIIATTSQYIDPARARQRAIDLKTLKVRLENLAEESHVQFLGLQNDQADINDLVALNKQFMDEFAEIQKEAFDRGVDV